MGNKLSTRRTSVEAKIIAFIIIIVVVSNLILGMGTYAYAKNLIFGQVQTLAENIASGAAAVTDGDAIEGITNVDCNDETIIKVSNTYLSLVSPNGAAYIYMFVLNEDGEPFFIATSDIEESSDSIGETFEMYEGMEISFGGVVASDEEPTTDEWGTFLSGYSPVFNSNGDVVGIVGADINYSELLKKINNLKMIIFIMYFIITVILAVGCVLIARILRQGFGALNSKVEELADGSGDLNREVEINSGDEFETIALSINKFIGEVRALAVIVAAETKESADNVAVINTKVTSLSASMEECSATSEDISKRLDETVAKVQKMADLVKAIDERVAKAAEEATKESENAVAHKEDATLGIRTIQDNVRDSAERAKAVDQVQVIAAKIKRIASETKILTLNAQVEAARAGDVGKGFAVVAGEMASLNAQIGKAVDEIEAINDAVINSVNDLISGTSEIDAYLTEKVLPDYDDYAMLGKEYGNMAEFICGDMTELTQQAEAISDEVHRINQNVRDISTTVADGASQVSKVNNYSNKIVDNMNRLADTSMLKMVR